MILSFSDQMLRKRVNKQSYNVYIFENGENRHTSLLPSGPGIGEKRAKGDARSWLANGDIEPNGERTNGNGDATRGFGCASGGRISSRRGGFGTSSADLGAVRAGRPRFLRGVPVRNDSSCFLSVEFHLFLIALSLRPGRDSAILTH